MIMSGASPATASIIASPEVTTQTRISWPRSVNSIRSRWLRLLCAEVRKRIFMAMLPGRPRIGWKIANAFPSVARQSVVVKRSANRYPNFKSPNGIFAVKSSVNAGWGNGFYALNIKGGCRNSFAGFRKRAKIKESRAFPVQSRPERA